MRQPGPVNRALKWHQTWCGAVCPLQRSRQKQTSRRDCTADGRPKGCNRWLPQPVAFDTRTLMSRCSSSSDELWFGRLINLAFMQWQTNGQCLDFDWIIAIIISYYWNAIDVITTLLLGTLLSNSLRKLSDFMHDILFLYFFLFDKYFVGGFPIINKAGLLIQVSI